MYLTKSFIRFHKISVSIFIFLLSFLLIHYIKPGFVYDYNGGFRPFGIGYKHKTVLPIWTVAIVLAIFSYLAVLYYLA